MPSISVSNLELYRMWRESDGLDLEWLLRRLRGEEPQTEAMAAGQALHSALETSEVGEAMNLVSGDYKFYFLCDAEIEFLPAKELSIEKHYGELLVRGRVDGLNGRTITDYKSTQSFDADRLMQGFQWRFYLDMAECDRFDWKVFVLRERFYREYDIVQTHELSQYRYISLNQECSQLAADFLGFVKELESSNLSWTRTAVLEPTELRGDLGNALKASLERAKGTVGQP